MNSFAQQLSAALEQYLSQSQNGSQLELDIQPASGQNSGSGQFLVTVKTAQTAAPSAVASGSGSAPQAAPTPLDNYVQVPFGSSTITVPSLAAELARQNAMMAETTPAQILQEDALSAAGDPMTGQTIPGTNLNWDNLTQDQQLVYIYAMNYGLPSGQTMQDYLNANIGPHIMANAPSKNPTLFGNT
jgi:hypothetical protein